MYREHSMELHKKMPYFAYHTRDAFYIIYIYIYVPLHKHIQMKFPNWLHEHSKGIFAHITI